MEPVKETAPLNEAEIVFLREIIEKDKRWTWLAAVLRNTAAYIAVLVGGLTLFWDFISKILKGMVK